MGDDYDDDDYHDDEDYLNEADEDEEQEEHSDWVEEQPSIFRLFIKSRAGGQ